MSAIRVPLLVLAATLAVSTPSMAEIIINPGVVQAIGQIPTPESEHSAVVPFPQGGSGGGDGPVTPVFEKTRNLPTITPGGGGDSSSLPGDLPTVTKRGPGDLALLCEVERDGDFILVNGGSVVLPQGARVRWKAGGHVGVVALNVDLEPGAKAMAKNQLPEGDVPCLATLL
jgi:hypothetical protein